jgi:hypothetical protein
MVASVGPTVSPDLYRIRGQRASVDLIGDFQLGMDFLRGAGLFTWGYVATNPVDLFKFIRSAVTGQLGVNDTLTFELQVEGVADVTKIPIVGGLLSKMGDPNKWIGGVNGRVTIRGNGRGGIEIESYHVTIYGLVPGRGGWVFARNDSAYQGYSATLRGKQENGTFKTDWNVAAWTGRLGIGSTQPERGRGTQAVNTPFVSGWAGCTLQGGSTAFTNGASALGNSRVSAVSTVVGMGEIINAVREGLTGVNRRDARGLPATVTVTCDTKLRLGPPAPSPGAFVAGHVIAISRADGNPVVNIKDTRGNTLASASKRDLEIGMAKIKAALDASPLGQFLQPPPTPGPTITTPNPPAVNSNPPPVTPSKQSPLQALFAERVRETQNINQRPLGERLGPQRKLYLETANQRIRNNELAFNADGSPIMLNGKQARLQEALSAGIWINFDGGIAVTRIYSDFWVVIPNTPGSEKPWIGSIVSVDRVSGGLDLAPHLVPKRTTTNNTNQTVQAPKAGDAIDPETKARKSSSQDNFVVRIGATRAKSVVLCNQALWNGVGNGGVPFIDTLNGGGIVIFNDERGKPVVTFQRVGSDLIRVTATDSKGNRFFTDVSIATSKRRPERGPADLWGSRFTSKFDSVWEAQNPSTGEVRAPSVGDKVDPTTGAKLVSSQNAFAQQIGDSRASEVVLNNYELWNGKSTDGESLLSVLNAGRIVRFLDASGNPVVTFQQVGSDLIRVTAVDPKGNSIFNDFKVANKDRKPERGPIDLWGRDYNGKFDGILNKLNPENTTSSTNTSGNTVNQTRPLKGQQVDPRTGATMIANQTALAGKLSARRVEQVGLAIAGMVENGKYADKLDQMNDGKVATFGEDGKAVIKVQKVDGAKTIRIAALGKDGKWDYSDFTRLTGGNESKGVADLSGTPFLSTQVRSTPKSINKGQLLVGAKTPGAEGETLKTSVRAVDIYFDAAAKSPEIKSRLQAISNGDNYMREGQTFGSMNMQIGANRVDITTALESDGKPIGGYVDFTVTGPGGTFRHRVKMANPWTPSGMPVAASNASANIFASASGLEINA